MKNEILKSYREWQSDDTLTEEDFNTWLEEIHNSRESIGVLEVDNIINGTEGVKFDYVTWLCDQNSDDVIIQITIPVKGGMSLVIDTYCEVPFTDLESMIVFIENKNNIIEKTLRITDYTDIGGEKTQIIIDHNRK